MSVSHSLTDISQVIAKKEKELHDIHDVRCAKLELLVRERDSLLLESSKRFEKLREDFEYNLSLISARDEEITRLEKDVQSKQLSYDDCYAENRSLSIRIEVMERNEAESIRKMEQDKLHHKRIFDELKDGIEQMRWAADEDLRSKTREITLLQADIQQLNLLKEESLESQRRDLTHTFENILKQREKSYSTKEQGIAQQIEVLHSRLEQLHTENTRLKNELADAVRKCDRLSEDLALQSEVKRQTEWQLEDERASKAVSDNAGQQKLQQATIALEFTKDQHQRELSDLQRRLGKAIDELSVEKDFRKTVEGRLEEVKQSAQRDLSVLERDVDELHKAELRQQKEIAQLKDERDAILQRYSSAKLELEALDMRYHVMSVDCESACEEVASLRVRLGAAEAQLMQSQHEFQDFRCKIGEKENEVLKKSSAQLLDAKSSMYQELSRLKTEHEEATREAAKLSEARQMQVLREVEDRHKEEMLSIQRRLANAESDLELAKERWKLQSKQLDDERTDGAALRLRLKLQESQILKIQQEANELKVQTSSNAHLQLQTVDYAPSPMFSEDQGPVSLSFPNSPNLSMRLSAEHQQLPGGGVFNSADFSSNQRKLTFDPPDTHAALRRDSSHPPRHSEPPPPPPLSAEQAANASKLELLAEENERLKRIVRDMRRDIEDMQSQQIQPNSSQKSSHSNEGDEEQKRKCEILEKRLQQTVDEVSRLRSERLMLMDVGNELRSNLNKVQYQQQQLRQWSSPEADDRLDDDDDEAIGSEYHQPSEEESYRYIDMQSQLQNRAFLERRQQTGSRHPRHQSSLSELLWGDDESSTRSSPSEKYDGDASYRRAMGRSSSLMHRRTASGGESLQSRALAIRSDMNEIQLKGTNSMSQQRRATPNTTSSRATASQVDAFKRLQEASSRKSSSISIAARGVGPNANSAFVGSRKVMNYAQGGGGDSTN